MWSFKKSRKEPRVFKVPEDELRIMFMMMDVINKEKTNLSMFFFWRKVAKLFPETKVGEWVETNTATSITITEILED